MEILNGLFYGLICGLSELFPVSAFAHQKLFVMFTGAQIYPLWSMFAHAGCLLAIIVFFWRQLKHMQREMRIANSKKHKRMRNPDMAAVSDGKMVMNAIIPIVLGLLARNWVADRTAQLWLMAVALFTNGVLLYIPQFTPWGNKDSRTMSPLDGYIYGFFSALSCLPGISGTACVLLRGHARGIDRGYILDLAILLLIPWLAGSVLLDLFAVIGTSFTLIVLIGAILGAASAFGGAYSAIALMRYLAVRIGYQAFAYYSWGLGIVCFILYLMI